MDDFISRQAAIDALAKFVPYAICDASTESYTNGLTDAYNLICQLPSAQPEIIRCKDCQYQCKGQNECETWNLCGYRPWQYTPTTDEHFCSYAERREDEH